MLPSRLQSLDGLRTISVALVVVSHLLGASSIRLEAQGPLAELLIMPLIGQMGQLGVYLFFVISGFVICRGLIAEGQVSLSGFYIRRFFRIVPPLGLYVAGAMALMWAGAWAFDPTILRTLTFTCNLAECGGWYGGHTWSLSVEEQFYLVMPVAFIALGGWRLRALTWAPLALMAVIAAVSFVSGSGFLQPFLLIAVGVACAMNEERVRAAIEAMPRWVLPVLVVVGLVLLRLGNTRLHVPAIMALAPLLGVIVMWVAFAAPQVLSSRPMTATGRVSYSIYLWQQVATAPYEGAGVGFYIVSVTACVAFAFASYRWVEGPLIRYARTIHPPTPSRA